MPRFGNQKSITSGNHRTWQHARRAHVRQRHHQLLPGAKPSAFTSENARQLLAAGALHSGNTFWKNG
jgi:hypothetical protein